MTPRPSKKDPKIWPEHIGYIFFFFFFKQINKSITRFITQQTTTDKQKPPPPTTTQKQTKTTTTKRNYKNKSQKDTTHKADLSIRHPHRSHTHKHKTITHNVWDDMVTKPLVSCNWHVFFIFSMFPKKCISKNDSQTMSLWH